MKGTLAIILVMAMRCGENGSTDTVDDTNAEATTQALTQTDYSEEVSQLLERFVFSPDSPLVNDDLQDDLSGIPSCDDLDDSAQCPAVDVTCSLVNMTASVELDFDADSCEDEVSGTIVFSREAAFDWSLSFNQLAYASNGDEISSSVVVNGTLRATRQTAGVWEVAVVSGLTLVSTLEGVYDIEDCPGGGYPCIDTADYDLVANATVTTASPLIANVELADMGDPTAGITVTVNGTASAQGTITGTITNHWISAQGPLRDTSRAISEAILQTVTFSGVQYNSAVSCTCPTAGSINFTPGPELFEDTDLSIDCGQMTITFSGCAATVTMANTSMLCTGAAANLTAAMADACF